MSKKQENNDAVAANSYTEPSLSIYVDRPVYQQEDLNRDTLYAKPSRLEAKERIQKCCSVKPVKCLRKTIPILKWLPNYEWKKWLFGDIVAGFTITVMQIPQGMGYGMLGGIPPICGIYMAFFPVLMYAIFGTSRHLSTGTFAIICLMTGKIVSQYGTHEILQNGTIIEHEDLSESNGGHIRTNIQVAITVTFVVACIQVFMFCIRLGIITTMFSDTLIKGLTCATSCHVVVSQLKEILGLKLQKRRGYFSLPLTLFDVASNITTVNVPSVIISAVTLLVILGNNYGLKKLMAKKTKIPFPIEIFVVIVGTTFSYFCRDTFKVLNNIQIIGNIPTGFPMIQFPDLSLIPDIFLECLTIAIVSYAITMSMALLFARKCFYEVDSNQELLALGVGNAFGSLFSCMPTCASVSRSLIQQSVGGNTQLTSLISCTLLLSVLLILGPAFESLPKCCLGTLIAAAIWPAVMQFTLLLKYWKLSKWDALVFLTAYLLTLFLDIGLALAAGVIISLFGIILQSYKPYSCLLGNVPNTDLYLDLERYKAVQEIPSIKIFHFSGILNFSSRQVFTESFGQKLGFIPSKILRKRKYAEDHNLSFEFESLMMKYIIIDFASITYVDPAGIDLMRNLARDLDQLGISLYIAGCSGPVFEKIAQWDAIEKIHSNFKLFPTIHDAVVYAQGIEKSFNLKN
ncbi:solute carrier family 26 member 6-like isoform X2 [Harmonia axyridis]|uniref:solute carrier family 26 member 6-like isoform X2 n=1 Tax=Harmonia axyridis TaxID=115357 RepID=UPI001E277BF2|nr:solute carrier family 26 member 6-like isoform X2 [Harmonia axyridis]XP_045468158.1 solute carrier family 26 member 6-like isoform X2 [Harmonia axyridis]XP_045468159.1 solute carrier family 26 member 6-like isoform X2 [Harmonia axyridis]XP_045468160.1 solute carrier family 26 member 6-like isoform X2 [Harmonia axyridis]